MSKSACPKCGKHSIAFNITPFCRSCKYQMGWTEYYLLNPKTAMDDVRDPLTDGEQTVLEAFN